MDPNSIQLLRSYLERVHWKFIRVGRGPVNVTETNTWRLIVILMVSILDRSHRSDKEPNTEASTHPGHIQVTFSYHLTVPKIVISEMIQAATQHTFFNSYLIVQVLKLPRD